MHPAVGAGVATLAAGLACVSYGTFVERRWYRRRELQVPGCNTGLRILHIADLHLAPPDPAMAGFVGEIAQRGGYDLVVATGDLLGARGAEDACVELLAELTSPDVPGVAVLGSNDVYAPAWKSPTHYFLRQEERVHGRRLDVARLVEGLEAHGYEVLRGRTTIVETRAGRVAVGGIDDPHLREPDLPPLGAVRCPEPDAPVRLGLTHAPYRAALDLLVDAGYDLLLAGHTHGGQVRFPPVGALVNNCDLPLDMSRGLSRWRGAWLHVTPGLGQSTYAPFRFACRPEATILTV